MKKLLALLMAVTLTFQVVTPVFAEEIEETQAATETVEVETEAPTVEIPTTEPPTTETPETIAPEETSASTEPQTTTEATEITEATTPTEETTVAVTEPTEETTEPTLNLFAENENVIASGECGADGDNLTWVLTSDGTLTISGNGKMKAYSSSSVAPWYTMRTKVLSVVVEDGVTSIGSYAFYACLKLASVTLPEGIKSIGSYGFQNCTKLAEVTIPDGVTSIGSAAFYGCSSLTSMTIPDGVTSIGYSAFCGCSSLTSVTIPDGVTSIENCTFLNCSCLTSVTIPDGVTSIGNSAFYGCSSLTSVTIPEGVTSIGWHAFSGCRNLTSVTIPEGVTSIGNYAFYNCSSLTSVTILEGVTSIGGYAFYCCGNLTSVTIPESVMSIGVYTFSGCGSLTSVTIPDGVTKIEGGTFYGCTKLESVTLPEGLVSIEYYNHGAFGNCTSLKNIKIPEGVTSIGRETFYNCSSLTSVTIPEGVMSIGSSAFYGCNSLSTITVANGNANYASVDGVLFNKECTTLVLYPAGHGAAYQIPEGVTSVGEGAFDDCSSLTSVTIPESVTSIGDYAFQECSSLTSVTIPEGVTEIERGTFHNCTSLENVTLPEGLLSIEGDYHGAFEGCSSLTDVTIPESVTSIGDSAFSSCSSLTSVTIPGSVTSIGSYAFDGCDKLADVYYGGTEEEWQAIEIGDYNDDLSDATIHYNSIRIHNPEHIPGKTATCTEAGNLECWHCLDCDEYFAEVDCTQVINESDMVLPALGHDMTKVEAVAPTYTFTGNNEYYTCSRCGKAFKDEPGEIETTVEEETLAKLDKGTEIRPITTSALISGSKLTLTVWAMPDGKKVKANWSLSEDSKAYATISSSGVLTAKTMSEVQNITVIAAPTDGSPEARKEIQILPKITVKQVEKFNLFHSNSRAELAITGGKVDYALLDGNKDFVLENENDHFYIRFANLDNPPAKPNTKATLQVFFPGSDTPATKVLTIATTNTAPKLKLSPTSNILNTTMTGDLTVNAEVLGTEDESLDARSATNGVTATIKNGKLIVTLDNAKTTTATIYFKGNDWAKEVKLTHKITVTNKTPTVKFTAKGKLDVLNPESEIVYTPKLTNATGTITGVRLEGTDAELFNAKVVDGLVHLSLVDGGEYATRKTYKITPVVTLLGNEIEGPTLSVKVTQSALKLAKIPNQTASKSKQEPLTVNLTVTSPATAEIADVRLNAKTTAALRNALDAADGIQADGGTVTFPAETFKHLKPGKYSIILDVTPANAAIDTKPIQAKFTLTVQK